MRSLALVKSRTPIRRFFDDRIPALFDDRSHKSPALDKRWHRRSLESKYVVCAGRKRTASSDGQVDSRGIDVTAVSVAYHNETRSDSLFGDDFAVHAGRMVQAVFTDLLP